MFRSRDYDAIHLGTKDRECLYRSVEEFILILRVWEGDFGDLCYALDNSSHLFSNIVLNTFLNIINELVLELLDNTWIFGMIYFRKFWREKNNLKILEIFVSPGQRCDRSDRKKWRWRLWCSDCSLWSSDARRSARNYRLTRFRLWFVKGFLKISIF